MKIKFTADKQLFAEICGFYQQFADIINLPIPDFEELEDWLVAIGSDVAPGLIEVHKALLLKNKFYARSHSGCGGWDMLLKLYCDTFLPKGAHAIEISLGYEYVDLSIRLEILRVLQDNLFDRSGSLADYVKSSTDDLNVQYLGRDRKGQRYRMHCSPEDQKFIIFRELHGRDHFVASNRREIFNLIRRISQQRITVCCADQSEEKQLIDFLNILAYSYFN